MHVFLFEESRHDSRAGSDDVAKKSAMAGGGFLVRVAVATGVTFCVIYGFELIYGKEAPSAPFFWIQMLTGSSWPTWKDASTSSPLLFAVAATVHVMLNIGPFLLVLWIAWTLVSSRRMKMELAKAFQIRDMDVKLRIKNLVFAKLSPQEQKTFSRRLDEIFDEATSEWGDDLTIVAGPKTAKRALEALEENIR
jgi:hypothetical protein